MTEPDILDFDTRVKKAGPLRQRGHILYFSARNDYPDRVVLAGPFAEPDHDNYLVRGHEDDLDGGFFETSDLDTAVMALYMAYLNHCNRDLEIPE